MDQSKQSPLPVTEGVSGAPEMTYSSPVYQHGGLANPGAAMIGSMPSGTQLTVPNLAQVANQHQLAYQQAQQFHLQQQQRQQQLLQAFWVNHSSEIEQTTDFKNQSLPLARIKKIMKADEDVRMISAEAPVVFSKACELFILELTLRAWIHTEENKRRTLQKNDIAAAISKTDIFDFLVDIVPRDDLKDEGLGIRAALPAGGATDSVSYYYVPMHQGASPGLIMGKPVDHTAVASAATYAAQQFHPVTYMWQQPQVPEQLQPPLDQDAPETD